VRRFRRDGGRPRRRVHSANEPLRISSKSPAAGPRILPDTTDAVARLQRIVRTEGAERPDVQQRVLGGRRDGGRGGRFHRTQRPQGPML